MYSSMVEGYATVHGGLFRGIGVLEYWNGAEIIALGRFNIPFSSISILHV